MELMEMNQKDWQEMEEVYLEAFPPEERAPYAWLQEKAEKKLGVSLKIVEDGKSQGFLYLVSRDDHLYMFYFALRKECRGQGIGSKVLQQLDSMYPNSIIFLAREQLDPEAENARQRSRRHAFYLRNGFEDTKYLIQEGPTLFACMSMHGTPSPDLYHAMMEAWLEHPLDPNWIHMSHP